jgi:hypothetical protein
VVFQQGKKNLVRAVARARGNLFAKTPPEKTNPRRFFAELQIAGQKNLGTEAHRQRDRQTLIARKKGLTVTMRQR